MKGLISRVKELIQTFETYCNDIHPNWLPITCIVDGAPNNLYLSKYILNEI